LIPGGGMDVCLL